MKGDDRDTDTGLAWLVCIAKAHAQEGLLSLGVTEEDFPSPLAPWTPKHWNMQRNPEL